MPHTHPQRKTCLDGLAIGLLLACCAFWGLQQILIKSSVAEMPPLWQATLRFVGASALLWAWCVWRGIALFGRDGTLRAIGFRRLAILAAFLLESMMLADRKSVV